MKKDRPGVILSVICRPHDAEAMEAILFEETATFGIRKHLLQRSKRSRMEYTVETVWGPVRGKLGWRHGEPAVFTPEFEDCAKLAAEHSLPLRQIYRAAESAFDSQDFEEDADASNVGDSHEHDHHSHDHSHDHHHHDHDHHHHDHDHHE